MIYIRNNNEQMRKKETKLKNKAKTTRKKNSNRDYFL